MDMIKR